MVYENSTVENTGDGIQFSYLFVAFVLSDNQRKKVFFVSNRVLEIWLYKLSKIYVDPNEFAENAFLVTLIF